jgi:hypothetical protein
MLTIRSVYLLAARAAPAYAQVATAELSGQVTDSTGAAIPNARLAATNSATGVVVRETASGAGGLYVLTFLLTVQVIQRVRFWPRTRAWATRVRCPSSAARTPFSTSTT